MYDIFLAIIFSFSFLMTLLTNNIQNFNSTKIAPDSHFQTKQSVSIIIPVLNEEKRIESLVYRLSQLTPKPEILFVDGGSRDHTVYEVQRLGLAPIYSSKANRGQQLNRGANQAQGDIFVFLHADTLLDQQAYSSMLEKMRQPAILGGAFSYRLQDSKNDWRLRLIEKGTYLRTHWLKLPYGDQAFFIKRQAWQQVGSFKEMALMEDVEWFERLKKTKQYVLLEDSIVTSPRRILKKGWLKSCCLNLSLVTLYKIGVSPSSLANLYYGGQKPEDEIKDPPIIFQSHL